MTTSKITHPAKYSNALIPVFASMLKGNEKVLDPFAGTGKIFSLLDYLPELSVSAIEIEPEWVKMDKRITEGNALALPYGDNLFDAIVVSPVYGNRVSDTLLDKYKRITYTSALGRKLNPNNSGSLQWGKKYRDFHVRAWTESKRVLKDKGIFILNIKNHIRKYKEQLVTEWHINTLQNLGFKLVEHKKINVPSMGFGQNRDARVPYESVVKFILSK